MCSQSKILWFTIIMILQRQYIYRPLRSKRYIPAVSYVVRRIGTMQALDNTESHFKLCCRKNSHTTSPAADHELIECPGAAGGRGESITLLNLSYSLQREKGKVKK